MLRHRTARRLNISPDRCLKCLLDVEDFLGSGKYTYAVKRLEDEVYEVVFKWVKLGFTRYYRVRFKVVKADDRVTYTSIEGSDYDFTIEFTLKRADGGVLLEVNASMKAGLMANLLGRRDYAMFIEELVDKGIERALKRMASKQGVGEKGPAHQRLPSCQNCLFYGSLTRRCYLLGIRVDDPHSPPCGGEGFLEVGGAEAQARGAQPSPARGGA